MVNGSVYESRRTYAVNGAVYDSRRTRRVAMPWDHPGGYVLDSYRTLTVRHAAASLYFPSIVAMVGFGGSVLLFFRPVSLSSRLPVFPFSPSPFLSPWSLRHCTACLPSRVRCCFLRRECQFGPSRARGCVLAQRVLK